MIWRDLRVALVWIAALAPVVVTGVALSTTLRDPPRTPFEASAPSVAATASVAVPSSSATATHPALIATLRPVAPPRQGPVTPSASAAPTERPTASATSAPPTSSAPPSSTSSAPTSDAARPA